MERLLNETYASVKAMLKRKQGLLRRADQRPDGQQRADAERGGGPGNRGAACVQRGPGQGATWSELPSCELAAALICYNNARWCSLVG